ncbi:MAG: oxidoreductase family protein [Chloroflexota bacterium]
MVDAAPAGEVSPAWLTTVLRRAGALPRGTVLAVESRRNAAFNSFTTHLALTYDASAPSSSPLRLLLKRSRPEAWAVEAGAREVAFYTTVMPLGDHPPMVVPCYAAEYDAASGESFVLLRDLSDTHEAPLTRDQQLTPGQNVPSAAHLEQVVDALARFHAYWWEHPRLGQGIAQVGKWFRDQASYERLVQRGATSWAALVRDEGDWLPAELRARFEWIFARLPRLWERYLAPRLTTLTGVTLTHGDAYLANFLCPRDAPNSTAGGACLIDWQSPATHLGAEDLVNLCATFWTPAQRHENGREERALRRYHAVLRAGGVRGYSWDRLLADYRLAVVDWLLVPLQDRSEGAGKDYWWPKLRCLTGAFDDLGCAELLEP